MNDMKLAHKFLPVGFYYKTLIKPKLAWPQVEPMIRKVAGPRQGRQERRARATSSASTGTPTCSCSAPARPAWRRRSAPPRPARR